MTYQAIMGLTPTLMSVGLLGKNIGSATRKGGSGMKSIFGMGARTLIGIPLIGKVAGVVAGL